jgi:RNA polymerase sigma-70 factor (ECF subfamily)
MTLVQEGETSVRARLVARDERALAELIELATPWLLGVVHGMLRDADEAEEVLLETFQLVWQRITPEAGGGGSLVPWILTIARNKAIDRLRSRTRRIRLGERFQAAWFATTDSTDYEPDTLSQPGWQVHSAIREALDGLPADQRIVVQLAYYEGMTQSAIAGRLSIPLGTVKTRLRLALGRLRSALAHLREWCP